MKPHGLENPGLLTWLVRISDENLTELCLYDGFMFGCLVGLATRMFQQDLTEGTLLHSNGFYTFLSDILLMVQKSC